MINKIILLAVISLSASFCFAMNPEPSRPAIKTATYTYDSLEIFYRQLYRVVLWRQGDPFIPLSSDGQELPEIKPERDFLLERIRMLMGLEQLLTKFGHRGSLPSLILTYEVNWIFAWLAGLSRRQNDSFLAQLDIPNITHDDRALNKVASDYERKHPSKFAFRCAL